MQPKLSRLNSQRLAAALVVGLCLAGAVSDALATTATSSDQPAGSNQSTEVLPQAPTPLQRPLMPPPGMSILPAQPYTAPDADDAQAQGCPVRSLKPLDLLV